ncbi:predicted protein [Scheffersomyces stipitis CBS 6054]|uniref:VHS domain-containing protein n=1 Tax=Scheffersomyces stipitis (strain ATCC 58785 / CBS 6054 / NBRC 10063 / NRRL Y-11545) TaxID=322104 RepID=A3LU24_PICST|nr:predicted protein [Scheffersomyces stipitis CBS 6054]ABN66168.2 predicted protein [Scheffersomyces stipitis CBS 6054]
MPIFGEKPYTSISVKINQLASNKNDDIDDSIELYLSDLLELIKLQPNSGAVEAARAVRKKIKYGDTVQEQLRALSILELLVLNGGKNVGPTLARDDKLIDVLKGILSGNGKTGTGLSYDKEIFDQVRALAIGWKSELAELDGYKYLASLWQFYSGSSRNRAHSRPQSPPLSSSPRTPRSPPPRPRVASPYSESNSKKDKKDKKDKKKKKRKGIVYADEQFEIPQINYKIEAPRIRTLIADCYTHTTALSNSLLTLPADISPHDDDKAMKEFDKCRSIRRKVLRYLQYVGAGDDGNKSKEVLALDEEFLGSLINSNEQLVEVFKKFDLKCGYSAANPAPNYDQRDIDNGVSESSDESYYSSESESEPEEESISGRLQKATIEGPSSRAKSPPPPRPVKPSALQRPHSKPKQLAKTESTDTLEADPFGDTHAVTRSVYD